MLLLALSPLLACDPAPAVDAPLPPETDLRPVTHGDWPLAEGALVRRDAGLFFEAAGRNELLAIDVLGAPALSADGRRVAISHRDDGAVASAIDVVEQGEEGLVRRRLVTEGAPDRVAMSPDGRWVVYVSGATGIASVWAAPFDGGAAVQLTNVGVEKQLREPGQPPEGFVPPPWQDPPRVEDGRVRWTSEDGEHEVALP